MVECQLSNWRILDANVNRVCEALRVVEDYVRFALDWGGAAAELKAMRHEIRGTLDELAQYCRRRTPRRDIFARVTPLQARDAEEDVGAPTAAHPPGPSLSREAPAAIQAVAGSEPSLMVAVRNLKRAQESLRSLEETARTLSIHLARRFESARFTVYSLEQKLCLAAMPRPLRGAEGLYVLVSEDVAGRPGMEVVRAVLAAGVKWVQLREKRMSKRALLRYAREAREATRNSGARLVINDHVDVALLAHADGVHLGEDDLKVRDARRLAGDRLIIGATSHSMDEAMAAAAAGADYVSVGPVFASKLKPGLAARGLGFVKDAVHRLKIPFVAIGGITPENVGKVTRAGAVWIAVSSAIVAAPNVQTAAKLMMSKIKR